MKRELTQRSLHAFRLTMMTGSVSSAAAALHRTQPAVSRLLKDLEHTVGFELFERVKGRLIPTTRAKVFFEQVQHSFIALERLSKVADEIREDRFGRFSIASFPSASLTIMPSVLATMLRAHAGLNLVFDMLPSDIVTQRVLTKQCDLGFVNLNFESFGVTFERKYELPCVCILPADHPLGRTKLVAIADLGKWPLVSLSSQTTVGVKLDYLLAEAGISTSPRIDTNSAQNVSSMVLEGVGVGVVDVLTAVHHRAKGGLVRPLAQHIAFEVGVIRLTRNPMTNTQRDFIEIFERELERVSQSVGSRMIVHESDAGATQ
jgi:DNA-binding transcriptional LysR family regulator